MDDEMKRLRDEAWERVNKGRNSPYNLDYDDYQGHFNAGWAECDKLWLEKTAKLVAALRFETSRIDELDMGLQHHQIYGLAYDFWKNCVTRITKALAEFEAGDKP